MGVDGEHLDLDLALSEAESPLAHDICLFDRISVRLSGSLSTSRSKNVTGSGIGGRFQTRCSVQKVSGHCYCSKVTQR